MDKTLTPKRFRLVIEIEADTQDDLADRLYDVVTNLMSGEVPSKSVFAGPSSRGHLELSEQVE